MDVISDTGHDETVTDIDVTYIGGTVDQITLFEGDTCEQNDAAVYVTFAKTGREGNLTMLKRNMLSFAIRKRIIHWPAPIKKDDINKGERGPRNGASKPLAAVSEQGAKP